MCAFHNKRKDLIVNVLYSKTKDYKCHMMKRDALLRSTSFYSSM